MSGELIATTSAEGLKPLGSQAQRSFELIKSEIEARLGPEHASIFGEPISSTFGDQIDWYASDLGETRAVSALEEDDAQAVRNRLGELVEDIRDVGRGLVDSPDTDEQRLGEALLNAVEVPDDDAVFARAQGEAWAPVIVNWARVADVQQPVRGVLKAPSRSPSPAALQAKLDAEQEATARAAQAAVATASTSQRSSFFPWLIPLGWLILLLLSAAILALMLRACSLNLGFTPAFCPIPQTLEEHDPVFAYTDVLRDRIAYLERQIAIKDRVCQPVFEKAEIIPPTAAPQPVQPALAQCPAGQQAVLAEELLVLLDGSGSMDDSASPIVSLSQLFQRTGPSRMDVAKTMLQNVVNSAPPTMPIGMVVFPDCGQVRDLGTFQPHERFELSQVLRRQRPAGGTPLAQAIRLAGTKLRSGTSIEDPANILLVSDGLDSCGGDPCAEARRLRQARPGVKISIIDMGRSIDLQCVADATGGFYVQADRLDSQALNLVMREAAGFEGRGICR